MSQTAREPQGVPETRVPETGAPETRAPEAGVPAPRAPEARVPDGGVPDSGVPDSRDDAFAAVRAPLPPPERTPSGTGQGWAYFAGCMMGMLGMFWALLGLVALVDEEYFTVRENRLLTLQSYMGWGWVHLVGGLVALAAGIGILWGGRRWARRLGIVVAALSVVVNLGFLSASPVWSSLVIALSVLAIHALTVHGWEIDEG